MDMWATNTTGILVCPKTHRPVRIESLEDAERGIAGTIPMITRTDGFPQPFGRTTFVMIRDDSLCAFPVIDGIPVMLWPEVLLPADATELPTCDEPQYLEAYAEMRHYNELGDVQAKEIADSHLASLLMPTLRAAEVARSSFPEPPAIWLDAVYDSAAEFDGYRHISPVTGKRVLQLGGSGLHAVKLLLAGAGEAWVCSPMIGELRTALALAALAQVADRIRVVVGVAEELPFADSSFDAIYSGGCIHHTITSASLPETARILRSGGRFAATEPWRGPLYRVGKMVFGRRPEWCKRGVRGRFEDEVQCRPLTADRVEPLFEAFTDSRVEHHGTFTRYPLIALSVLGFETSLRSVRHITDIDDKIAAMIPGARNLGSSVALIATK
jgi:SAM-dependent methyltransferase/uncharacterized protein YbaR (Trm112 family)